MNRKSGTWRMASMLGLLIGLVACSDGVGVSGPQNIAVSFTVSNTGSTSLSAQSLSVHGERTSSLVGGPLVLEGTNGTLSISEIFLIVNKVELEPADGSCDLVENSDDEDVDCPDFEAPPRLLDLPLDGSPVVAVSGLIPPGTYDELEFEIEDLEDDEDDEDEALAIRSLRNQIATQIPDWPEKASALVVGTFQPTGGNVMIFRVFLDAEIEVEMDLLPHLLVGEDGTASRVLTIDIRPDMWFKNADGTVLPLSDWDYGTTQELLEFEIEIEDGFFEIEIDS